LTLTYLLSGFCETCEPIPPWLREYIVLFLFLFDISIISVFIVNEHKKPTPMPHSSSLPPKMGAPVEPAPSSTALSTESAGKRAISRRCCLSRLAVMPLALVGCGKSGGPSATEERANEGTAGASAAILPKRLSIYAWSNYFSQGALDAFEAKTGCKPDYQIYGAPEEMEARLRSDPASLDVVVIDSFNLHRMAQLGLLQELDRSRLGGMDRLDPRFLGLDCDPQNRFSIPHMWGTTLLAYRKDRVPDPGRSWALLWEPRLKGRVMMIDEKFDPFATALLYLHRSSRARTPEDYAAATGALITQIEQVDVRYGDDAMIREKLVSGEVWAAMCYSGDASEIASECPDVEYFIPDEGAPQWMDSFVISRDSPHGLAAHEFINFMLRPEIAALNSNETHFATPNADASTYLSPTLAKDARIFPPPEMLARCQPLPSMDAALEGLVNKSWHTVQLALSRQESLRAAAAETAPDRPVLRDGAFEQPR
jgi:spermidine/putrescine transport system substrate-binding protein